MFPTGWALMRSYLEPSSSSATDDQYCTQALPTFALEATRNRKYTKGLHFILGILNTSYELPRLASFPLVFTYRRIWVLTLANQVNSVASSLLLQHGRHLHAELDLGQ